MRSSGALLGGKSTPHERIPSISTHSLMKPFRAITTAEATDVRSDDEDDGDDNDDANDKDD